MNEIKQNWLKVYIIDVLPCITVALYLLAFIYNTAFFSVFNINVIHYISLSDMLLGVLEPLTILAVISLWGTWTVLYMVTSFIPTMEIEKKSREKNKNKKLINIPFRLLRCLVRIKNIGFIKKMDHWLKEKEETKRLKREKIARELEQDEHFHSWQRFTEAFFLAMVSYMLHVHYRITGQGLTGLMWATAGLILPLLYYIFLPFIYMALSSMPGKRPDRKRFFSFKPIEIFEVVIVFYAYAVVLFYIGGEENAKYFKNNDTAQFEIKANDGTLFCDSTYRYINNISDMVFLTEKATGNNVVLSNEGITYMKINFKDENNKSIIVSLINKDKNGSKTNHRKDGGAN